MGMSDPFAGFPAFVAVAEEGSFVAAGERLSISGAAVSKAVARLEDEMGARLFVRTTRSVRLSPEGAALLPAAQAALRAAQAGREAVAVLSGAVTGPLSVSMSPVLGRYLTGGWTDFLSLHPGVQLEVRLSDRLSRLVDDRVDVAVRIGALNDSSLVQRNLADTRWVTAASPAYLARAGTPATVDALGRHHLVQYLSPRGIAAPWHFVVEGERVTPPLAAALRIDHGDLVVQAAREGGGVVQAMDFMVEEDLRAGRLVEVLADCAAPGPPIHALCLPGQRHTPRVRALMDHLSSRFDGSGRKKNAVMV